jgi:hypothetical protein
MHTFHAETVRVYAFKGAAQTGAYIHTYIQTNKHTHTHVFRQPPGYIHTDTCIHTLVYVICVCNLSLTCFHGSSRLHLFTQINTCIFASDEQVREHTCDARLLTNVSQAC